MLIRAELTERDIERIAVRIADLLNQSNGRCNERWLDVEGAAEHLRLTANAVRGLVKRRQLPVHRTKNGRLRFSPAELDQWVRSGLAETTARTYDDRP
jgi:excisionase family DNA binding protein